MKVVLVTNDFDFFWIHKSRLAKAIMRRGHSLTVLGPSAGFGAANLEKAAQEGIEYVVIPISRTGMSPLAELGTIFSLYSQYRRLRPNVVHQLTIKPVIYGSIAARLAGVPRIVNSITGLGFVFVAQDALSSLRRWFVCGLYKLALASKRVQIIFENADDRGLFLKMGLVSEARSRTILGGGVEISRFTPTSEPAGTPIVILPARMLWDKGVGEFVEACRLLKKDDVSFRALLVGPADTSNPARIPEEQLRKWDQEGVVEWAGFQENMVKAYRDCHVVCLPSYREGGALVLVEALASGRPIVATDVPGCRNVVENESNGLLVPAKDPIALAAALKRLLVDPELRQKMGTRGRKTVEEKFSSQIIDEQTFEAYGC